MDSVVSTHTLLCGLEGVRPAPTVPISTIVAWGVRTPGNIGAIVRLAANFGCDSVFFVEDRDTKHNLRRIRKTAVDGPSHVEWSFVTSAEFAELQAAKQPIVGLETSQNSVDLRDAQWPEACTLMVGSERLGLPPDAIEMCDLTAHIPTCGPLRSLNVSHALAIALFDAACKQKSPT